MFALLLAGTGVLLVTATLFVTSARPRSVVSFFLGVYLAVWTEIVVLAFGLSAIGHLARTELVLGLLATLVAAVATWIVCGRCRPPSFRPALRTLRASLHDPVLVILMGTVGLVGVYAIVLGIGTPQNEWDSLSYHLTRAAFWMQQASVSYIPDAFDSRINVNPPNAEIGQLATMLLSGDDRFVWLPQLSAIPATMLAIFGIGRRAGIDARGALFGALVFACLPLALLQASTALNDLVVASFFTAATYFALGTGRRSAAGAAVGLALAFGTKFSAPLLLPLYLLVVLVARRRRVLDQTVIVAAGLALGAAWYVLNAVHTGTLDGGLGADAGQIPDRSPGAAITRAFQLSMDALELPGAFPARNVALYALCGAAFAVWAGIRLLRRQEPSPTFLVATAIVVATPLLVRAGGGAATSAWRSGLDLVGRDDLAGSVAPFQLASLSDSATTWYGPVGALLTVVGGAFAVRSARTNRSLRISLAASPVLFLLFLAAALDYDPWRGRFFVFPMALAAASWGLVHSNRSLAWAVTGATVTTAVLVLANSSTKPLGVRLLAPAESTSVLGQPRWRVQTRLRVDDNTNEVVRFVEKNVPEDASIGLSLRTDDFAYPYFGAALRRTVTLLPAGVSAPKGIEWIVEAPGRDVPRCTTDWQTSFETESGFHVLRRASRDSCAGT